MKKKQIRKRTAAAAAVLLAAVLLAACGNKGDVMDGDDMFQSASGGPLTEESSVQEEPEEISGETDAVSEAVSEASETPPWQPTDMKIVFDTTDIDDNPVSTADYSDAKLVMLNFWEPWCGPCVGELPDLARLYEDYKDKGLVILGIYSELDMTEEAKDLQSQSGITYPILHFDEEFRDLHILYVPTTYFTDGEGNALTPEPYIGSRSYDDWAQIVEEILAQVDA